jgi:hypothetical protein
MATFDADEITDLAEILGTNSDELGAHLTFYAAVISDPDKTKVLSLVTEWQAISTTDMVTAIEPKDRNFGVRVSGGAKVNSLASRIASLLQWTATGTTGQTRLIRA